MKALKINVETKSIEELDVVDWRDIAPAIGNGCKWFCNPVDFENGDTLFADDESLLNNEVHGAFIMQGWEYPIVGNAVILGLRDDESCDAVTKKEELDTAVFFLDKEGANEYVKSVM